jgi:hypothetical protein
MIEYSLDQINSVKANVDSPALTGVPTAPTAAPGTSTTQVATTAFVTTADNLAVKKGEFLLGVNAPYITDGNVIASTQWNQVGGTWNGSPFSGANGDNQGYLFTQVWTSANTYRLQTFYNINSDFVSAWRRMDNGVWSSWVFNWTYGTANGNVLIGTTTDNGVDKLQVKGNINSYGDKRSPEITVSTTDVTLITLSPQTAVGYLAFISYWNTSTGAQGHSVVSASASGTYVDINHDGSNCSVSFASSDASSLKMKTGSGTVKAIARLIQ